MREKREILDAGRGMLVGIHRKEVRVCIGKLRSAFELVVLPEAEVAMRLFTMVRFIPDWNSNTL